MELYFYVIIEWSEGVCDVGCLFIICPLPIDDEFVLKSPHGDVAADPVEYFALAVGFALHDFTILPLVPFAHDLD